MGGSITVLLFLTGMLRNNVVRLGEGEDREAERQDLECRLLEEIVAAAGLFGDGSRGAVQQGEGNAAAEQVDAEDHAQSLAYG